MVPSLVPSWAVCPARAPLTLPDEPSWVGAREEASPAACLCSPGPGPPPKPLSPQRPAGTRRRGLGYAPSDGVTSRGDAALRCSASELAATWPWLRPGPRSRSRHRCPQPPGSRAGPAQAWEEGPLSGKGGGDRGGDCGDRGLGGGGGAGSRTARAAVSSLTINISFSLTIRGAPTTGTAAKSTDSRAGLESQLHHFLALSLWTC